MAVAGDVISRSEECVRGGPGAAEPGGNGRYSTVKDVSAIETGPWYAVSDSGCGDRRPAGAA